MARFQNWGERWDSNPRRPESQSGALPTELRPPSKKPPPVATLRLARPAGLEPATAGLEGRCSIRLSYGRTWIARGAARSLVGAEGFEPPTLCSQSRCATRLRHAPPVDCRMHPHRHKPARGRRVYGRRFGASILPNRPSQRTRTARRASRRLPTGGTLPMR